MISKNEQNIFVTFIEDVQVRLTTAFERVDGKAKFEFKNWQRTEGGGGRMAVIRGEVVEKAGANVSTVSGSNYPAIDGENSGKPFEAMGVSTITHMFNPYAPIGHMNVRLIKVGDEDFWFGGGADMTPCFSFPEDNKEFHDALRRACDLRGPAAYGEYSKWCDEYFYIIHRKSVRGVGGIFFDYLKGSFEEIFPFVKAVANAYVEVFPKILERRKSIKFSPEEKEQQLFWRGRYAEFNLAYDRGTRFGFMTGGNIEAILVSMPPVVKW